MLRCARSPAKPARNSWVHYLFTTDMISIGRHEEDDHNDHQSRGPNILQTLRNTPQTPLRKVFSFQKICILYAVPVTNMRYAIVCALCCYLNMVNLGVTATATIFVKYIDICTLRILKLIYRAMLSCYLIMVNLGAIIDCNELMRQSHFSGPWQQ